MDRWDAIVIGSGMGGLTAAVALARAGQRVLVLEQHYLPGGWTHSFSLGGRRYSPGVHYVGECGDGGFLRRLFEGLGVGRDLVFCEMNPDGFDHLDVGGARFDVPKGRERFRARLEARFPREVAGIRRYFDVTRRINQELRAVDDDLEFPRVLTLPLRAPTLLRWGLRTQQALLDATVKDPLLRAILAAQNGDHGLSPRRISLAVQASLMAHYDNGAFYPRGGAKRIPSAMLKELRRHGGRIRLRARATRILVEKGRVCGVELEGGERLFARTIVANADPHLVYTRLLPPELGASERRKARRMRYSVATMSVFAAVDLDLRAMGFDSGNLWWFASDDVAGIYERVEDRLPGDELEFLFVAISSLKDPQGPNERVHTLEMFTFVPYDAFLAWQGSALSQRPPEYARLKGDLGARMLEAAERVIPGLRRGLVAFDVGTPLTNVHYCASPFGNAYGTAKTRAQVGPFGYRSTTPGVEGLHLCGASTLAHGVAGAAMSGLQTAARVLGVARGEDLLDAPDGSMRVVPADDPEAWRELDRAADAAAPAPPAKRVA